MEKIKEFIKRAEKLYNSAVTEPEFKTWKNDVIKYLNKVYGDASNEAVSFDSIKYNNSYLTYDVFNGGWRENILKEKDTYITGLKTAIFYLNSYESDSIIDIDERIQKVEDLTLSNAANKTVNKSTKKTVKNKNVFIVNGRNDDVKAQVESFLLKTVNKPIILNVDEHGINMSSGSGDTYFEIDPEGKWQLDFAKKLKAMKLDIKKKKVIK